MEIKFTETVLRDAQQSLMATRLPLEKFVDILDVMDSAGYYSVECWGGATFDSCLRYLDEDPWERLRTIKNHLKTPKLQMLLRGQNLLGYKPYPDDVVKLFIQKSIENGINIIRIFDALNDIKNIELATKETIKHGGDAQCALCYTISPVHTLEKYTLLAKQMEQIGASSICIKDMAGVMSPKQAFELVSMLKSSVKIPIFVHTHCTTGLGSMTLLKAVEAGCDGIDTAISTMSGGTSQPPTETMVYALKELGYKVALNQDVLKKINAYFKPIKESYIKSGVLDTSVLETDAEALIYQIPGGMLSNLIAQLKAQNAIQHLDKVLIETPKVREDLGFPPLVTPMSQMVGVQAVANVLSGERYKNVSKEIVSYIKGEYGKSPGQINSQVAEKILKGEKVFEGRFADTLEPAFEKTKQEIKDIAKSDEDVLSYLLFPTIAEKFFQQKIDKLRRKVKYTIQEVKEV